MQTLSVDYLETLGACAVDARRQELEQHLGRKVADSEPLPIEAWIFISDTDDLCWFLARIDLWASVAFARWCADSAYAYAAEAPDADACLAHVVADNAAAYAAEAAEAAEAAFAAAAAEDARALHNASDAAERAALRAAYAARRAARLSGASYGAECDGQRNRIVHLILAR